MRKSECVNSPIECLCFSKDRPMQLEGYIRSLQRFASEPIALTVLFCVSNKKFDNAYLRLQEMFPEVEFVQEINFRRHVTQWLKKGASPFLLFGVDDWIYRQKFDVGVIREAFSNPELYAFSLRLGLEITYSGMYKQPLERPQFIQRSPYLLWNWTNMCFGDWTYPFEICATVYRRKDTFECLKALDAGQFQHPHWAGVTSENWGHPSKFEAYMCCLARNCSHKYPPLYASFSSAKGSLVTVNIVQDECDNFVYESEGEVSSDELLDLWEKGYVIDIDSYSKQSYTTIHMGDIRICHRDTPSNIPFLSDFNIHKVMLSGFLEHLDRSGNDSALPEPERSKFTKLYQAYFSLPGAESHCVRITPVLDKNRNISDPFARNQNIWALSRMEEVKPRRIIDFGSSTEALRCFALISPTTSYAFEPHDVDIPGVTMLEGNVLNMPFDDESIEVLTSFSFIESLGLGYFNDPLNPNASFKALEEIKRTIALGGHFIGSLILGRDSFIEFNRRRGIPRQAVLDIFSGFEIVSERFLSPDPVEAEFLDNMPDHQFCRWCFDLIRIK